MNISFWTSQVGLTACGVTAVFLTTHKNPKLVRFACIAGLLGEPFWLWSSWLAQQPGIMVLSFVYGYCWFRGFQRDWLTPKVVPIEGCKVGDVVTGGNGKLWRVHCKDGGTLGLVPVGITHRLYWWFKLNFR